MCVCVCVGTICACNARRDTLAGHVRWDADGELVRHRIGWFEEEFDGEFWPAERKILCPFASVLLDMIWHDIPKGTKAPVVLVVLWRCLAVLEESAGNDGGEPSSGDETGHCGVKKGQEKAGVWGCGWLSRLQPFFSSCLRFRVS